jgi:hypothetical protein
MTQGVGPEFKPKEALARIGISKLQLVGQIQPNTFFPFFFLNS